MNSCILYFCFLYIELLVKSAAIYFFLFFPVVLSAQKTETNPGLVIGTLLDADNSRSVSGASITLTLLADSSVKHEQLSLKDGEFIFSKLFFGYYRLRVNAVGYANKVIDSIHIRPERFDFDLNDIRLNKQSSVMNEVTVFAEKPLIENKDGKIIFNTGESALSSGATTTELLKQTPLVNVDNDGKILLRGKEVKILIDDKPVELDAKQLQDLMESMPGSLIEKIEVMTTPPPQYANEREV